LYFTELPNISHITYEDYKNGRYYNIITYVEQLVIFIIMQNLNKY